MTALAETYVTRIESELRAVADPGRAVEMRAYMRDRFEFLGVPSPERRAAMKRAVEGLAKPSGEDVLAIARVAWDQPERELQSCAVDLLRTHVELLDGSALPAVRGLVTHRSWWDSIDAIASRVVGPIVRADRSLGSVMDEWIEDDDFWVARVALLHQLLWRSDTDAERLFRYCERRAADTDFFIRKAIGWALREHSKTHPDEVRRFVAEHDRALSPLSKREALRLLP